MGLFSKRRPLVRFQPGRGARRIVVRGDLSAADRAKLRRLLASLPIEEGEIDLRHDGQGRTRIIIGRSIPERFHQPIRNLLGNLSWL